MLKEDFDDDVVYRSDEEWNEIFEDIDYAVANELAEREYVDYDDLDESGQVEEIIEIVEDLIRLQHGLGYEVNIRDDINDYIMQRTGAKK